MLTRAEWEKQKQAVREGKPLEPLPEDPIGMISREEWETQKAVVRQSQEAIAELTQAVEPSLPAPQFDLPSPEETVRRIGEYSRQAKALGMPVPGVAPPGALMEPSALLAPLAPIELPAPEIKQPVLEEWQKPFAQQFPGIAAIEDPAQILTAVGTVEKLMRLPQAKLAQYWVEPEERQSWGELLTDIAKGEQIPTIRETMLAVPEAGRTLPGLAGHVRGTAGVLMDIGADLPNWVIMGYSRLPVAGGRLLGLTTRTAAKAATEAGLREGLIEAGARGFVTKTLDDVTGAVMRGAHPDDVVTGKAAGDLVYKLFTPLREGGLSFKAATDIAETHVTHLQSLWKSRVRLGVPFTGLKWTPGQLAEGIKRPKTLSKAFLDEREKLISRATGIYSKQFAGVVHSPARREEKIYEIAAGLEKTGWFSKTFRPLQTVPAQLSQDVQSLSGKSRAVYNRTTQELLYPLRDLDVRDRDLIFRYIEEGPFIISADDEGEALARIWAAANELPDVPRAGETVGYSMRERIGNLIRRTGEWRDLSDAEFGARLNEIIPPEGITVRGIDVLGRRAEDAAVTLRPIELAAEEARAGIRFSSTEETKVFQQFAKAEEAGTLRDLFYGKQTSVADIKVGDIVRPRDVMTSEGHTVSAYTTWRIDKINPKSFRATDLYSGKSLRFLKEYRTGPAEFWRLEEPVSSMHKLVTTEGTTAYGIKEALGERESLTNAIKEAARRAGTRGVRPLTAEELARPATEMLEAIKPPIEISAAPGRVLEQAYKTLQSEFGDRVVERTRTIDIGKMPKRAAALLRAGDEHLTIMREYYGRLRDGVQRLQGLGMDLKLPGDLGTNYIHKMALAGERVGMRGIELPAQTQSVMKKAYFRTPLEATMLRDVVHDPKILDALSTPEMRSFFNFDPAEIPTFSTDLIRTTKAWARQFTNLERLGDVRELVMKHGVYGPNDAISRTLGYSRYFGDLDTLFPKSVINYLDDAAGLTKTPVARQARKWYRVAASYPRRSALFALTFLRAQGIDQIPSVLLSGITQPKAWKPAIKAAATALTYDTARLAEISAPRTFAEQAKLAVIRRIRDMMKASGQAESELIETVVRELTTGSASDIVGTGIMRQLGQEAPRNIVSKYGATAERIFNSTAGLGVRIGGVYEDFWRAAQYGAMRADGLSGMAARRRVWAGFVNYAAEANSWADEIARDFSYFFTYTRQRVMQYGEAAIGRPWLMYLPYLYKRMRQKSILDPKQEILLHGLPDYMRTNLDTEVRSWQDWPFDAIGDGMEFSDWTKQNFIPFVRPRYSQREIVGDLDLVWKRAAGMKVNLLQDLIRKSSPLLQAAFNVDQGNYEGALFTLFPPSRILLQEMRLDPDAQTREQISKRRKKFGVPPLSEVPYDVEIDGELLKLEKARQGPRIPRLTGPTKEVWNALTWGLLIDFKYIPDLVENLDLPDYERLARLLAAEGNPVPPLSDKQKRQLRERAVEQGLPPPEFFSRRRTTIPSIPSIPSVPRIGGGMIDLLF